MKYRLIVSALLLVVMAVLYGVFSGEQPPASTSVTTSADPSPAPASEERSYSGLGK